MRQALRISPILQPQKLRQRDYVRCTYHTVSQLWGGIQVQHQFPEYALLTTILQFYFWRKLQNFIETHFKRSKYIERHTYHAFG